jgi:peroxidase
MRALRPTWPSKFGPQHGHFGVDNESGEPFWDGFHRSSGGQSSEFHWTIQGDWCPQPPPVTIQFRSFDGSGNNLSDSDLNATGTAVERIGPAHFTDGISEPLDGPNPRAISNVVVGDATRTSQTRKACRHSCTPGASSSITT